MDQRTCSVPECERPIVARGWCLPCYKRWWNLPEPRPETPPRPRKKRAPTFCDSCGAQTSGSGKSRLCHPCWLRRDNVNVEEVTRFGITFRRYPDAKASTHRYYFKPGGYDAEMGIESLHREVYKREIGPIPPGFHVHHIDGDASNNEPDNLKAITPEEHLQITLAEWKKRGQSWLDRDEMLQHLDSIRDKATEWHRSDEGREWHRQNAMKK